ncbi:hypothetical protein PL11201_700139 [Planktothrix sp. PCC 11201]|nr:hypothetical protein PL11201_700139 [Planktothrix sp. PCC 11201]
MEHRLKYRNIKADRRLYVHYDVAKFQEDIKTLQEVGSYSW